MDLNQLGYSILRRSLSSARKKERNLHIRAWAGNSIIQHPHRCTRQSYSSIPCCLQAAKLAAELSDLVAYCRAVPFKGFEFAKENCTSILIRAYLSFVKQWIICLRGNVTKHGKWFKHQRFLLTDEHYEMSSFGEKKAFKLARDLPKEYICYTKKHMARTYPAGGRVDSSNYDPTPLWSAGVQLGNSNDVTS